MGRVEFIRLKWTSVFFILQIEIKIQKKVSLFLQR